MKATKAILAGALIAAVVFVSTAAYADGKANPPPMQNGSASATSSASSEAVSGAAALASTGDTRVNVRVTTPAQAPAAPAQLKAEQNISIERAAASAVPAALTSANGSCAGSVTASVQVPGFGIGGGSTFVDEGCDTRYDVIMLDARGEHAAAFERGCDKPDIRAARKRAGTLCSADRETAPQAPVASRTELRNAYIN